MPFRSNTSSSSCSRSRFGPIDLSTREIRRGCHILTGQHRRGRSCTQKDSRGSRGCSTGRSIDRQWGARGRLGEDVRCSEGPREDGTALGGTTTGIQGRDRYNKEDVQCTSCTDAVLHAALGASSIYVDDIPWPDGRCLSIAASRLQLPPTPLSPQLVRTPTLPKRNDPLPHLDVFKTSRSPDLAAKKYIEEVPINRPMRLWWRQPPEKYSPGDLGSYQAGYGCNGLISMYQGSTAIGCELIGQAFCLVFHAYHFDPGIDMCASFSTMLGYGTGA